MPPPSFLDLPRELRQQILLETFNSNELRHPNLLLGGSYCWEPHHVSYKNRLGAWVICLKRVHKVVAEDVVFVDTKWQDRLDGLWE